jgi:hypothetical protein
MNQSRMMVRYLDVALVTAGLGIASYGTSSPDTALSVPDWRLVPTNLKRRESLSNFPELNPPVTGTMEIEGFNNRRLRVSTVF